ncbi:MAG: hypothetical protein L6V93_01095 [Clostridiales bacterium]|nr:MAG: hypothetical protein L6V93_01095 [Clostridiales bacterium]
MGAGAAAGALTGALATGALDTAPPISSTSTSYAVPFTFYIELSHNF